MAQDKIVFNSISNTIVMKSSLQELSGRDKVNLFSALMDELGITKRIHESPSEMEIFKKICQEQIDKVWFE